MSLIFHSHPFALFGQKVLIALYENATPFEARLVDLGDEQSRAGFLAIRPNGKMPVLEDRARGRFVPESSIIIEYLQRHYPGPVPLIPEDAEAALEVRLWDRTFDNYIALVLQKIAFDRRLPPEQSDPHGVELARQKLREAYAILDRHMEGRTWAAGEAFSLADCAAAPSLRYADLLEPFRAGFPNLATYSDRLLARPSFARAVEEAAPYRGLFPQPRP